MKKKKYLVTWSDDWGSLMCPDDYQHKANSLEEAKKFIRELKHQRPFARNINLWKRYENF